MLSLRRQTSSWVYESGREVQTGGISVEIIRIQMVVKTVEREDIIYRENEEADGIVPSLGDLETSVQGWERAKETEMGDQEWRRESQSGIVGSKAGRRQ